jgi:hypothetical protein
MDTRIVGVGMQLALLLWERVYRPLLSKLWFPQVNVSLPLGSQSLPGLSYFSHLQLLTDCLPTNSLSTLL